MEQGICLAPFFSSDNYYRRDLNMVDISSGKVKRLITDLPILMIGVFFYSEKQTQK